MGFFMFNKIKSSYTVIIVDMIDYFNATNWLLIYSNCFKYEFKTRKLK